MPDRILTLHAAHALGALVDASMHYARVARLVDHDVINGTARSIGTEMGGFLCDHEDVRDAYLRVTTDAGWEAFWPIAELIAEYEEATFVIN